MIFPKPIGYFGAVLVSLVLMGFGVWTMYNEGASYLNGGTTRLSRLAARPQSGAPVGLTNLTQQSALLDCEKALRSFGTLEMKYQGPEFENGLASRCLDIANAVTAKSPVNSFAWMIAASASAQMKDWPAFNDSLGASAATGPYEGWVARLRIGLAEDNYDRLSTAMKTSHDHDLALLVSSWKAVPAIASRYVRDEAFRERMAAVLKSAPPADQKRFISSVNSAITAAGK